MRKFFVKTRTLISAHQLVGTTPERTDKFLLHMADTNGLSAVEGRETFVYLAPRELAGALRAIKAKAVLDAYGPEEAGKLIGKLGDVIAYLEGE
jgi:hypothetical protein